MCYDEEADLTLKSIIIVVAHFCRGAVIRLKSGPASKILPTLPQDFVLLATVEPILEVMVTNIGKWRKDQ